MVPQRSLQMTPQTIVVLRALQLGDLLCAVPALRSLRAAFPRAHIALIGLPWSKTFVNRFTRYLDEFIEFPGYPGLPERPVAVAEVPDFLAAMQRRRFDLALQMHGSGRYTNQLLTLLGARMTAGFVHAGDYCPDEPRFMPYPDHLPEADRHLALLRHLGIPAQDDRLEFPLNIEDAAAFHRLQSAYGLQPGSYVCLHPGGRGPSRRWAPHLFSLVADRLVSEGYRLVITGTEEERPLVQAVMAHMREEATDLVGQTDLGTVGVLLTQSALLVATIPACRMSPRPFTFPASLCVSVPIRSAGVRKIIVCTACSSDRARPSPTSWRQFMHLSAHLLIVTTRNRRRRMESLPFQRPLSSPSHQPNADPPALSGPYEAASHLHLARSW